ncbi:hypothetical protein ACH5RR_037592 [Cinchona calisaya]|uniref:MORF/ORRM1/DAG-like MORF domain-containing protein n=1 Tax=Cinchona calisaya TaxID=153742 RepID=A0ABD2Y6M5_9GENT
MATRFFTRSRLTPTKQTLTSVFSRSITSLSLSKPRQSLSATASTFFLLRLRPLAAVAIILRQSSVSSSVRGFATSGTSSYLNNPQANLSNRPPQQNFVLDGCDFEHWLVVMEKPEGDPTRDEIIDSYIKTLAKVVGSEEEARMKIYSVSTRCYYAFGALVSEELSYKLKELDRVRWVLPDSYLNVKNKDYGGEPFINGQAVPYDCKYHAEWEKNSAFANERNKRGGRDRPRDYDRSRNFEPRNMHPNQNAGGSMGQRGPGGPQNMGPNNPGHMPSNNMGGGAPNRAQNFQYENAPNNVGAPYQSGPGLNQNNYAPNNAGTPYQSGPGPNQRPNQSNYAPNNGGAPYQSGPGPNHNSYAPNNGGAPYQSGPGLNHSNYAPNIGGAPYQSGPGLNQNNFAQNMAGGNPYQNQNMPGRDVSPPQNYQ